MKILIVTLFILLLTPNAYAQFDEETTFERMEKRIQANKDKWRGTSDDKPYSHDNPYDIDENKYKKDRVKALKRPKKTKNQLDTWGRNGGQTMSSEEVLRRQMESID